MIDVFAQGVVSQALRKGLLYFFMYKAIVIQKKIRIFAVSSY